MNKYVIPVLIDEGTNKGWQPVVLSIKIIKSLSEISLKFLNWGDFCSMCQKPLHIFDWWKIIFFMGKLCYLTSICLKVHETHQSGTRCYGGKYFNLSNMVWGSNSTFKTF